MNILLTGGTGFLGKRLLSFLSDKNINVYMYVRGIKNSESTLGVKGFVDSNNLDSVFKNIYFDAVIHAATQYKCSSNDFIELFNTNIVLPINILKYCYEYKVKKFVNIDTFFNDKNFINYNYLNEYKMSKRHFMEWGRTLCLSNPLSFLNLKLFHMYGPGDSPEKFIPWLIHKCSVGDNFEMTEGLQKRDFIHIDDVVSAVMNVLQYDFKPSFKNFEVGTGKMTSIKELAILVKKLSLSKSRISFGKIPNRPGEVLSSFANNRDLKKLGWKAQYNLTSGLKSIINPN